METFKIKGHVVEYIDGIHTYLVDGIELPSITQILKLKFGEKYNKVPIEILRLASEKGTKMHKAIENTEKGHFKVNREVLSKASINGIVMHKSIEELEKNSEYNDIKEVRNYLFLKKYYGFEYMDGEIPVILFENDEPIACGRVDMLMKLSDRVGLADFKRTYTLDKEYLGYQLNLYRIAYQQSYGTKIEFLKGIHLRDNTRKLVEIPINEELPIKLVHEYMERRKNYE